MSQHSQPKANKELGQHYLSNLGIVQKICDEVMSLAKDNLKIPIVEIGPGPGALTGELLKRGHNVLSIEIDSRMTQHLKLEFAKALDAGQFTLLQKDAMKLQPEELPPESFIVCGNLPYNVGSQIVFRFLEEIPLAKGFCFMLQKEVVQKFMPPGPKESWSTPAIKLSLLCQFKDHFWVKPGSFSPPPKVDSGVFSFFRKEPQNILVSPFDDPQKYAEFSRFLATAFSKKRKMLRGIFPALKNEPIGAQRAEELSPDEIFALSRKLGRRE